MATDRPRVKSLYPIKEERDANVGRSTLLDIKDADSEEEGEIKEEPDINLNIDVSKYEGVRRRGRGSFLFEAKAKSYARSASENSTCATSTSVAFSYKKCDFLPRRSQSGVTRNSAWKTRGAGSLRMERRLERKTLALQDLLNGRTVVATMRPSDTPQTRNMLTPGTVISAPQHSPARTDEVIPGHENLSFSSYGAIYSKYRKMIILESWGEHSVCLPLYSYQGRGLQDRWGFREEYLSVRNYDDVSWAPKDNEGVLLRAKRFKSWKGQFVSGRTVVKLTERCTLYKWDKCSIEGYILPDDFERLWHEYLKISRGKKDESIHEAWLSMPRNMSLSRDEYPAELYD